jgi:hypothetical protein
MVVGPFTTQPFLFLLSNVPGNSGLSDAARTIQKLAVTAIEVNARL